MACPRRLPKRPCRLLSSRRVLLFFWQFQPPMTHSSRPRIVGAKALSTPDRETAGDTGRAIHMRINRHILRLASALLGAASVAFPVAAQPIEFKAGVADRATSDL